MALFDEPAFEHAAGGRATDAISEWLGPGEARVDGRRLRLPMAIEECSLLANVFSVGAEAVRGLLRDPRLAPACAFPGKTFAVLLGVSYRESPLGTYGEGAVLFPVTAAASDVPRFSLGDLFGMLTGDTPQFVYRMPVDGEFTMHAGRFLWGYPKYLARIDVSFDDDTARVRLEEDGELVYALSAPAGRRGRLPESRGTNLTARGGVLRKIRATVSGEGVSFRMGGRPPEIGTIAPLARDLRALGLPRRPLVSASIRRARLRFEAPETVVTASSGTR